MLDPAPAVPPESSSLSADQSSLLMRQLMDNAGFGMLICDISGIIEFANRSFAELMGLPADTLSGTRIIDLVHPDDVGAARSAFAAMINGSVRQLTTEVRCLPEGGRSEPVWVLADAAFIPGNITNDACKIMVQVSNIDRQKRAEQELAASEARWNFALEGAGQGVWDHNLRDGKVFYSRMWWMMRGYDPETVDAKEMASTWMSRIHPDDRDRIAHAVERQNEGRYRVNSFEYRERHKDGHWVWILSRGKPVEWNADGSVVRILGTDTDITALKRAQASLASEKELLRTTLHAIADGVISTDADGNITLLNAAAEQMTGWRSADAIGRHISTVFKVVDGDTGVQGADPVVQCLVNDAICSPQTKLHLLGKSGTRRDIHLSAAPVHGADGTPVAAVVVFQDVTEANALQRELAHAATHDSLTGLPNRPAFERALHDACEQSRASLHQHALCFVDLDRFKAVNDTAGHAAGDNLLMLVADTIRNSCRINDFAARIGGDEFAVLLRDCSLSDARRVMCNLIKAVCDIGFVYEGTSFSIGASAGIAMINRRSPSATVLLGQADAACYTAKANGRNRAEVFGLGPKDLAAC